MTSIVIGDLPLRSESLQTQVSSANLIHVPAVRVSPAAMGSSVNQVLAELLYGRHLSPGEVGCTLAHRQAYEIAEEGAHDWALVLEDDAGLPASFTELQEAMKDLPLHRLSQAPSIVSLYSSTLVPRTPRRLARGPFRQLLVSPSTTVAYLINRRAWSVALCSPPVVVSSADWPPWSTQVGFYAPAQEVGILHDGDTTIYGREDRESMSRRLRARHLITGKTYALASEYFPSRADLLKWFSVSPIRRRFGRPESYLLGTQSLS